jgi:hypothetical protein
MKKALAYLFYAAGIIASIFLVVWAISLNKIVLASVFPEWFVYLSFIFFPVVFAVAPLYEFFTNGNWIIIIVNYGFWVPGASGVWIGNQINPDI